MSDTNPKVLFEPTALLKAALALQACDPSLLELLPENVSVAVKRLPSELEQAYAAISSLTQQLQLRDTQITESGLAIAEYANQSGQGQMMMKNIALCLQQIRRKKEERKRMGNQGWG